MALYKSADGQKLYNYDPSSNGGFALETQQGGIPVGVLPAGVLTAPIGANINQGTGSGAATGAVSAAGTLERVPRYPVDPTTGQPTNPTGTLSPLQQAQTDLFGDPATRTPLTETEKQAIRDKTRAQFDEQIAAINASSNLLVSDAKLRGEGRLGQDRAIQNNRGTGGSSFGTAQTAGVEKVNASEQAAIESERQIRLAGVYDKIDQRALDAIQAEKTLRTQNANGYIEFLKNQQTGARDDIKSLATSGIPLEQLPEKDFQSLLKDSGYDPSTFKAIWAANASAAKAASVEGFNTKIENGQVITSWFNKTSGKTEFDIRQLDPVDSKNYTKSQFDAATGNIVLWNEKGESKVIKATAGKTIKPETTTTKEDNAAMYSALQGAKGTDGKVSMATWAQALNDWRSKGYSQVDFEKQFADLNPSGSTGGIQ